MLPPAGMFDGATFHVDELVRLIRNADVPFPKEFTGNGKRLREEDEGEDLLGRKKYRDE